MIHIFIINSHAGKMHFSADLRNALLSYTDIKYYIFHTRAKCDEKRLVRVILNLFEGEKIRLYCCGGSGTLCNVINQIQDFSNIEIAFYAKGLTNDFLKVFSPKERLRFEDIKELINGEVVDIDYIKTNHGNCLNSFSIGLDSVQVTKFDDYRSTIIFGKQVPYTLGLINSLLFSKPVELDITLDGTVHHSGFYSEMYFGNGPVIGGNLWFEDNASIVDGIGICTLFKAINPITMIKALSHLTKKEYEKNSAYTTIGHYKTITIKRTDGAPFVMNCDGEIQPPQTSWSAEIINKGIRFVVPKGVSVR